MNAPAVPNIRPLKVDLFPAPDLRRRLSAYGARFLRRGTGGAPVYQAASGHLLRVVAKSATTTAIEVYPAGCAC